MRYVFLLIPLIAHAARVYATGLSSGGLSLPLPQQDLPSTVGGGLHCQPSGAGPLALQAKSPIRVHLPHQWQWQ